MPPELLQRYWTLHGPHGEVITCELMRTAAGLEVRCGTSGSEHRAGARASLIRAETDALNLAEAWKAAYLAQGWSVRAGPRIWD